MNKKKENWKSFWIKIIFCIFILFNFSDEASASTDFLKNHDFYNQIQINYGKSNVVDNGGSNQLQGLSKWNLIPITQASNLIIEIANLFTYSEYGLGLPLFNKVQAMAGFGNEDTKGLSVSLNYQLEF